MEVDEIWKDKWSGELPVRKREKGEGVYKSDGDGSTRVWVIFQSHRVLPQKAWHSPEAK